MNDRRVIPISGIGNKAPACFLVEMGTARFLLDLGEGPPPNPFPDLSEIGEVDAILVSHGHADHIGGLHLAGMVGDPPIYATAMTKAFAGHPALKEARNLPLHGAVDIAGITVETGRAGHAAGGIWMRIGGADGVLYTGDICRESLLYPLDTPLPARTLIADASYGVYDESIAPAMDELIRLAQRGPLLLPLPPTGRGIEIAVLLHEAGLPVGLCAKHREAGAKMVAAASGTLVDGGADRLAAMLAAAAHLDAECPASGAMVVANAAGTAGLSSALLPRFEADAGVNILITGHVDTGTPAQTLVDSRRARFRRWNVHPRLSDLMWLQSVVRPEHRIFAFCEPAIAEAIDRDRIAKSAN